MGLGTWPIHMVSLFLENSASLKLFFMGLRPWVWQPQLHRMPHIQLRSLCVDRHYRSYVGLSQNCVTLLYSHQDYP